MSVLIVDDHPMVREGLRSMLEPAGVAVVGEAGTGEDALRRASTFAPDVVLLDLELPDLDGLVVLQRLKALERATAVVVITMHDDPTLVRRAVEAGASGYVLKGVGRRELLAALEAVRHGESVIDPALLRATLSDPRPGLPAERTKPLTSVEQEMLRLVAQGLTNREIGKRLRWSVGTVKNTFSARSRRSAPRIARRPRWRPSSEACCPDEPWPSGHGDRGRMGIFLERRAGYWSDGDPCARSSPSCAPWSSHQPCSCPRRSWRSRPPPRARRTMSRRVCPR